MNIETYNKAKELQDKISKLEYEMKVLTELQPTQIRFGGNFSVSIPIDISKVRFSEVIANLYSDKAEEVAKLKEQFKSI